MKTVLRKVIITLSLAAFTMAIVTPAQAGRTATVIVVAPVNTKPLVSTP